MSTLERANEIEQDFYRLKAQEFGPAATEAEIRREVEKALIRLRLMSGVRADQQGVQGSEKWK